MLKLTMLASAIAMSVPVFAQDLQTAPSSPATAQTAPQPAPVQSQGAPIAGAPVTTPDAAAPADVATAAAPAEPASAPASAAPAAPAGATQIADVVGTEFPTYDKNGDKMLDKAEFGAWMVALKTASDPSTKAGDAATVKWVNGAFASADTDRSKHVSQAELTKYLSQGAG